MVHKDKDLMLFDRIKYCLKKLRFVYLFGFLYHDTVTAIFSVS